MTEPTPGRVILVLGAGVPVIGMPSTFSPRNWVPAALVLSAPVELSWLVVLTDCTAVAPTRPPSRLMPWMVDDPDDAVPVAVVSDAADVSMVPVSSTPVLTEAAVLVCVIPAVAVHPRVDSAERPDWITGSPVTWVPYAAAW